MTRILLVEDEISLREPLAYRLVNDGFEVVEAETGTQAVAALRREGADLVLLDLMLPEMDGTAVCRELRSISDVPVIMLTAKDDEIDKLPIYIAENEEEGFIVTTERGVWTE